MKRVISVFQSKYRKLYEQSEISRQALMRRHHDLIRKHEEQTMAYQILQVRYDKALETIKGLQEELTKPKRKPKAKEARQFDA